MIIQTAPRDTQRLAIMVSSVSAYHQLVAIHKPLGILVLVLVAIRLVNRLVNPPPPLPEGMPPWQRFAALGSHVLLYILMFAVPLVGWAMLSAARYPVVLYGALQLPPIMLRQKAAFPKFESFRHYRLASS